MTDEPVQPMIGRRRGAGIAAVALHGGAALVFLWLLAQTPVLAIPEAGHDDGLFVRLAGHLLAGEWLGPYDNLTLAKGPFYPLFLAAGRLTGLPALVWQGLAYALGCLVVARGLRPWLGSETAATLLFLLLLFSPAPFGSEMTRVMREGVYTPLGLGLFGAAVWWLRWRGAGLTRRVGLAVGLGLGLAAYWTTREEGVWILPALLAGLALAAGLAWRDGGVRPLWAVGRELALAGLALAVMQGGIAGVKWLNWRHYGVADVVEFKQKAFLSAYGALSRVEHRDWRRYVVVPREVLARLYAVSPAAAELRPYFDRTDNGLIEVGCQTYGVAPCDGEFRAGWFMWGLRDAAALAGHYRTATAARDYYARLAGEINQACDAGRLACLPRRTGMAPPFRREYAGLAAGNFFALLDFTVSLKTLAILTDPATCADACRDNPLYRTFLDRLNAGPFIPMNPALRGAAGDDGQAGRSAVAAAAVDGLAAVYRAVLRPLLWIGVAAYAAAAVGAARRWRRAGTAAVDPVTVAATAALLLLASRLALLAYLDVTAIPSRLLLYVSPAFPFLILFIFTALWAASRLRRGAAAIAAA